MEDKTPVSRKKKLKKVIFVTIIIFAALLVVLALLYAITIFLEINRDPSESLSTPIYNFYPVNYDENIFDDPYYLSKNRDIMFDYNGVREVLTETDLPLSGTKSAELFYSYIHTVINGEYNDYKSYFSEHYLKKFAIPEAFTMQKLYNIEIIIASRNLDTETNIITEIVTVNYKIFENNGTFRSDIGSGMVKSEHFEVITESDGRIYINDRLVSYSSTEYKSS